MMTVHSNLPTTKIVSAIDDIPQKGLLPLIVPDFLQENDGARHEAEQVGRGGGDGDGCICPYAEANEQVQAGYDDQEEDLPEPSNMNMAASRHDNDTQYELLSTTDVLDPVEDDGVQRILPAQSSYIPEEPLYQNVEETPEDQKEDVQPPPQGRVARAARGPRQAAHLGQATGGHRWPWWPGHHTRQPTELTGDGERNDENSGGHADQQVGHEELGAVQDVTATIAEYSQESAQEVDEEDISEGDISEVTSEDTTNGQSGEEQAREASSLSISLPPSPLPFPPPRGPGRIRKQRNKFN